MTRRTHGSEARIRRRDLLKTAAVLPLAIGLVPSRLVAADDASASITDYLERLRKPDGGYGWDDEPRSHLTPTYGAVGCYHVLGKMPPDAAGVAEFVRTHHPFRLKKLEREIRSFEHQQIQGLLWLGESAEGFREQVESWREPFEYTERYEKNGYPIFEYEVTAFVCRKLLGLPMDTLAPSMVAYLESRRRPDGSFNNTPAEDGSGGHVFNTWWGLRALDALGRADEQRDETIGWVRDCQWEGGGFTWNPRPFMAGNDDAAYTWAAVRILERLGAEPARRDECVAYLSSLRNADGGFGPRAGCESNPVATYYAVDALRALGALDALNRAPGPGVSGGRGRRLRGDLKVFTIQIEAHGKGSPAEAVDLARSLKIDLWGAKNAAEGWISAAQAVADRERAPVTFFVANEEYGTFVGLPGQGVYSHTSDLVAPAGAAIGPSMASRGDVSWEEFRQQRLEPLQVAGGRLVWQFNENEVMTRLYMDDSLDRGGYAAISTFHFGNPDFANSEPFLKQYQGRIPYVALQDAHGDEPWWWGDQLEGFRTLFLATKATWEGWLEALANNRVVAVRHDTVSGGETWMHGLREVIELVRRREPDWRWWDGGNATRPPVSIVAVTPDSRFEAGRPDRGVMLRVRCLWENTAQGRPKRPRTELVRLLLDGREVPMNLVADGPPGRPADHFYTHHVAGPATGEHTATAVVRWIDSGDEAERTVRFAL